MSRIGVYPGSFNPPTRAHVEIALTALRVHELDRVDFAMSTDPLGKGGVTIPSPGHQLEIVQASVEAVAGLGLVVTDAQLIVDMASGYDVVIMGADKWAQVNDPSWYDDEAERDTAIAALPTVALAPRPPHDIPDERRLPVATDLLEISSTAARAGRRDWMTDAAAAFDLETGAWTDPERYRRWVDESS